ncbi:acyl-CoA thioesterase [Propylenella binzhouense]|uniref:Thioesterase n=1 Tax=Propylenella binzhouense TaxID=2555902 RepID=A0A964WTL7_9HYPH|nr:thioesterase family protein [Propylenella binzhouense]MYZ47990.1 hypothetical protein [Propylenella binzhouense]
MAEADVRPVIPRLRNAPVTLRSFVNTWECDENGHMNVQFYAERFDQAAVMAALDGAPAALPMVRHVRYHRELHPGEGVSIHSALVLGGPHPVTMVHGLFSIDRDVLSATVLDGFPEGTEPRGAAAIRYSDVPEAAPRAMPVEPVPLGASIAGLLAEGARETFRGIVPARLCNRQGIGASRVVVHCMTDGAGHAWSEIGVRRDFFEANNLGRAVVESKLTLAAPLEADMPVVMLTSYGEPLGKVFLYRHHVFDLATGRLMATGDIGTVVFDMAARKAVDLPPEIRGRIAAEPGQS